MLIAAAAANAQEARTLQLPEVLRQIPPGAPAVLIVPHIKRASDDLTRLLEGMDRANLLLGARPIDQIKSISGYNIAIDDNGAAAMIITDITTTPPRIAWLLPTDDAATFLAGNFTGKAADAESYARSDGSTVFARVIGSHVLIGDDAATVRDFTPGEGMLTPLTASLRGREIPAIADANFVLIARKPMLASLRQRALGVAAANGVAMPAIAVLASKLTDELDSLIMTLQGDPLAMVLRSVAIFDSSSSFGSHAPDQPATDAGLARIPESEDTATLALNVDLAALGGEAILRDIAALLDETRPAIPAWLASTRSIQLAIHPSPAGSKGGLLNGASVAFGTAAPDRLRDALRSAIMAGATAQPPSTEAKWSESQQLADGSMADAFEVVDRDATPESAAVSALLFGSSGMRGYVRQASADSLVMTFAQRPAVLQLATNAAQQASTNAGAGYANSPTLKVMRRWMWTQRDIEGYVNVGSLLSMVGETIGRLPGGGPPLPEIDPGAPPVGFAMDVSVRRADGVMIVPAAVLAPIVDEILRMRPAATPLQDGN